jgi:hypothetical protein
MARPIIGSLSSIVLVLILAWSIGTIAVRGYNRTEWTVGGDKGWSFGVAGWENDKPIQAGDMLGE